MMDRELSFPFVANPIWVLGFFLLCLVILHVALIKVWRLSKTAWRKVDYIWLTMAMFGLLAAAADARRLIAANKMYGAEAYMRAAYDRLLDNVAFLGMDPGAVCRTFARSEFSPPNVEEMEQEFGDICGYGKALAKALPSEPPDVPLTLPTRPGVTDEILLDILGRLDYSVRHYEEAREQLRSLEAATGQTDTELVLIVIWPLLFSIALALRITKVTGEILLDDGDPPVRVTAAETGR